MNTTVIAVVAPAEVAPLDAFSATNIRVVRTEPDGAPLDRAIAAWKEARRTPKPYLMHDADPLATVAAAWARLFEGRGATGELEVAVAETVSRWRARSLDLPDYYVVVDAEALGPTVRHWFLGVLRAAAPARVVAAAPSRPPGDVLGELRAGPWWPDLDQLLAGIDRVVPDQAGRLALGNDGPGLLRP